MRAMKDSGVEWIGEIPEGWGIERIKHNAKIINGATPRSDNPKYWDGDIVWVTPADMKDDICRISTSSKMITEAGLNSCGTELVPEHSVIISNRAPIGRMGLTIVSLCTNQGCKAIVTRSKTDPTYLCYYLFIQTATLNMLGRGTTFLELSTFDLANFVFPCPSQTQQSCIATFLDAKCAQIDAIIEKQQQVIEKLKAYKQSVITEAVTKGLDPTVPMKDSGVEWIGEIAISSHLYRLKHLVRKPLQYGANESGIEYSDDMARYVRITDITPEGTLKDEGKLSLSLDIAKEYLLDEGDILFARSGATVGKTMLYYSAYRTCAFAGYLIRASAGSRILSDYLYYFTKSSVYESWKNGIFIQATIQNIGADKFSNMVLPVPSVENQKYIVQYLNLRCLNIDTLILSKQSVIDKLTAYKKSLIYEAVTGKMEV